MATFATKSYFKDRRHDCRPETAGTPPQVMKHVGHSHSFPKAQSITNNLSDPRQRIEQTIAKTGSMWRLTFMTMTIMRLNFAAPIDYSVSSDGAVFRAERLPSAISTAEDEPRTSSETSVCPPASGISLVEVSLVAESPPLPLPLISPGTVSEAGATGISPVAGASTVDAASACAAV